jgi:hypothetical protein
MLTARRIRSIIEKHPLPDKSLQNVLEQWMIDLAEEIVENIKNEQSHLATKDDIKQVIEMMNARFEAMEKNNAIRFESIEKRLSFMQWLIGGGVLLVAHKLFFPHIFPR